ncbi:MAG: pilus assembly protein PilM [Thermodesulfobacteriota bacterium]
MYGKFVGLDIGCEYTKIVLIRRGFRTLEVLETIVLDTISYNHNDSHDLQKTFLEHTFPKSDVATSIPDEPISIKVIQFPFTEPNKIDQVYKFELENVSTFDPEEKVHGYHFVRLGDKAEAVVCMFEKDNMMDLLNVCGSEGIDPKVITYGPVAIGALEKYLPRERPLLLIDIGASHTRFSLFDNQGLRRVRSSSKAGKLFTDRLMRILGVSFEEVQSMKFEGIMGDDIKHMSEAFAPVLGEIKKTIKFFEMELKEEIKTVLLAGGLSQTPGFSVYLQDQIKKDVETIFIPDLGSESTVFAQSYALALYGSALKSSSLNFRKDEFQFTGSDEELRKKLLIPAFLLSIILLISLYRSGSGYFELKNKVDGIERQIEANVKEVFPSVKVIPKPVTFMETEVKKVNDRLGIVEGVIGKNSPLDVLKDISVSIPPNINLTVDEINFENEKTVRLRGRSDSYQEVAKIEEALSESGMFEKVNRDSTNPAANNTIKFQVSLVLK